MPRFDELKRKLIDPRFPKPGYTRLYRGERTSGSGLMGSWNERPPEIGAMPEKRPVRFFTRNLTGDNSAEKWADFVAETETDPGQISSLDLPERLVDLYEKRNTPPWEESTEIHEPGQVPVPSIVASARRPLGKGDHPLSKPALREEGDKSLFSAPVWGPQDKGFSIPPILFGDRGFSAPTPSPAAPGFSIPSTAPTWKGFSLPGGSSMSSSFNPEKPLPTEEYQRKLSAWQQDKKRRDDEEILMAALERSRMDTVKKQIQEHRANRVGGPF